MRVVYPKDDILAAIDAYPEYDFYYNTDSHWNYLGGYIGAKDLVEELGGEMDDISCDNVTYDGILSHGLDLSNMTSLGKYILEENSYGIDFKPDSQMLSSHMDFNTEYRFTTTSPNDKKLLIIRDSYCSAMANYIAHYFSESVMVYYRHYSPEMLYSEDPDIVVYEIVERSLPALTNQYVVE